MIVIGLMSGTSADGIEAAVVELSGTPAALDWQVLSHVHVDFDDHLRAEIFACFRPETSSVDRLCRLNFALGRALGQAALNAAKAAGLSIQQVDLIGSHGQTLWHIPAGDEASTLQMGEPAVISEITGRTVVSGFRTRDMAAGGQGAPLVAYVDQILLSHPEKTRAVQNIGGIANVTWLPAQNLSGKVPLAFDTGPGNMLIDDAVRRATGGNQTFDQDGQIAAGGQVCGALLQELLSQPYFEMKPPKTTGRELFGSQFGEWVWQRGEALRLCAADVIATLTEFTAASIAEAYRRFLPIYPDEIILSGGGAFNLTLVKAIRQLTAPATVLISNDLGLKSDAKEAVAFAVLAYETLQGRTGNLPAATGARRAVVLGNITPSSPAGDQKPLRAGRYTEGRNTSTENIDQLSTLEMLRRINAEDEKVPQAVRATLPQIASAVDAIAVRMQAGGRLIYIGAGTSGRLGILDASECPPTFSTSPEQVIGIIAGGKVAITDAVEGAEDNAEAGQHDLARLDVNETDSVVGIAASGYTPYVLGGMAEARRRGALVISLACNSPAPIEELADISIAPIVGPEAVTGSTRLKAGTAQKLVLNMISTGTMVRLGKTYGNLMVDVQMTNAKLRARGGRIVAEACRISEDEALELLASCNYEVKTAIVAYLGSLSPDEARKRLAEHHGVVRKALMGLQE